ncbi:copper homeostasis protein CutC [Litoribacter populi]|uniref:copper homeostasis protein CutC n=1 Tax=Litoribacter populi TaxID=2598460 RepID=UPI00117C07DB|nr:copper homeostasis protein CutC [Litoribacter populi]
MANILLEAPVFSVEAAFHAAEFGVDRLELCSDFTEGGTTPSLGMFQTLKSQIDIPIFVMIRPRGGNFVYTAREIEVMVRDIKIFLSEGADGFVFGVQKTNGEVDLEKCSRLLNMAGDKSCTFHRAFDNTPNLEKSLEDIISLGFHRILTSGGHNTVSEGMANLLQLIEKAQDRIIIMPGGGSKPEHVHSLFQKVPLQEIHASCKKIITTTEVYRNESLQISANPKTQVDIDPEIIKQFKTAFNRV